MGTVNKTKYAILGMLHDGPCTGYEIKSFMRRSTAYFWRESDSTIYPTLKVLAKEKRVQSEVVYVGKKKKELFSITEEGQAELKAWIAAPTGSETPRNEFLLKLFFVTDRKEIKRLCQDRLQSTKQTYEAYRGIEERLVDLANSLKKEIRLKALRYGMAQLKLEIEWLESF